VGPIDISHAAEITQRITIDIRLNQAEWSRHLADETRLGLTDDPPWIPPVWFYDEVGSALFEEITRLPAYYPTNSERSILAAHAAQIAELTGAEHLVELGSGTSEKTSILLDALEAVRLQRFIPFDCSESVLRAASRAIASQRPRLAVHAVVGDFHDHLDALPMEGVTLLAFLGSTIGNFEPHQRSRFLSDIGRVLNPDDWLLLGTDLVKPAERLEAAYDDPGGVTARFNLNCLNVMNEELGADFVPGAFSHRAVWNTDESRVEMHLVAQKDSFVTLTGLGPLELGLSSGEYIRTEISTKFTEQQVTEELHRAGLDVALSLKDPAGDFLLTLAHPC
jgi:L-histidine N-alpha-methyltransferase